MNPSNLLFIYIITISFHLSSIDRLSTAVGDLDSVLEIPVDVHQAPVVLPVLAARVVHDLPGLVEALEPEVVGAVGEGLADPALHERVHLVDTGDRGVGAVGDSGGAAVSATLRWPAGFGDNILANVRFPEAAVLI